jgi:6-phosphofructokinase 2
MPSIATVCLNPAVDRYTDVDRIEPDTKLRCSRLTRQPGGGGVNVSRVLRRLGADSMAMYLYGGLTGRLYQHLLEREELTHCGIETKSWTRENTMVFEKQTDSQYRFILPGPEIAQGEWQGFLQQVEDLEPFPEFLVASGSLPPGIPDDGYAQLARVAGERDARYVLDSSGDALKRAVEEGVFLLKPNANEMADLVGRDIGNREELIAAARELIGDQKVQVLVVSLGSDGALLVTRDRCEIFEAPKVKVDSVVGAGDSMVAGVVAGLARGRAIDDAVRLGVAAGAAAVTTPASELALREDIDDLYAQLTP